MNLLPSVFDPSALGPLGDLVARVAALAEARTPTGDSAHGLSHVRRVTRAAHALARDEGADLAVVLPAALLHELWNYPKNHPDSHRSGEVAAARAKELLAEVGYPAEAAEAAAYAIAVHPYSRGIVPVTLEARVLQDADRLDALGAIGIARCFATAERLGSAFYAPEDPFCEVRPPDDRAFAVDHFFKKLFLVPQTLHTAAARREADRRVEAMRAFLASLRAEIV